MKLTLFSIAILSSLAVSSQAAVIMPVTTHAHNISGGGGISSLFDDNDNPGTAGFTKPNPNDPSTWTATGQAWQDDWQGNGPLNRMDNPTPTNGKIGWVTFDFGTVQQLDRIFIWNLSEGTGQPRRTVTYNLYWSNGPSVAPVSGNGGTTASLDYNFASGGWTQLGGTRSLLQWSNGTGADGIETLGVSARYIGIEILTNAGATDRVGLNEVVFTNIPEPSVALLSGLGVLMLLRRKKR